MKYTIEDKEVPQEHSTGFNIENDVDQAVLDSSIVASSDSRMVEDIRVHAPITSEAPTMDQLPEAKDKDPPQEASAPAVGSSLQGSSAIRAGPARSGRSPPPSSWPPGGAFPCASSSSRTTEVGTSSLPFA